MEGEVFAPGESRKTNAEVVRKQTKQRNHIRFRHLPHSLLPGSLRARSIDTHAHIFCAFLSLSLSHTHTHSLTHSHSLCYALSLSLSLCLCLLVSVFLSLSLSVSLALPLALSLARSPSLFLSFSLSYHWDIWNLRSMIVIGCTANRHSASVVQSGMVEGWDFGVGFRGAKSELRGGLCIRASRTNGERV